MYDRIVKNWDPIPMWQSGPDLGSCSLCGAAVFMDDADKHKAWHEGAS